MFMNLLALFLLFSNYFRDPNKKNYYWDLNIDKFPINFLCG